MKKLLIMMIIFLFIISGCSNAVQTSGEQTGNKLQVVTTFYPMYYFAKQIAGTAANVDFLIPNGVEPHDWEPTVQDMAKIQDANVFIYNSRYFETWTEKALNSMDTSKLKVVEASDGIQLMNADKSEGNSEASKDPHVWLSPVLAAQEVNTIAKALESADPKHKAQYQKNAEVFKAKLADVDQLYKQSLEKAANKEFVTQHAAFGYLAKQYGLTQIPIAGLSPDVEPTLGKLADLADLMKKKHVKLIYFEGLTSSKVADTLANEIGAQTDVLNPLEGLTKEEQAQGLDYIGVMKKNLDALKKSIH